LKKRMIIETVEINMISLHKNKWLMTDHLIHSTKNLKKRWLRLTVELLIHLHLMTFNVRFVGIILRLLRIHFSIVVNALDLFDIFITSA
jgi:hypothetical protein